MALTMKDVNDYPEFKAQMNSHAVKTILASARLHFDSEDIKENAFAFHQFIPTAQGFKIDLALYTPTAFPDENLIGHRHHFAIEFGSLMHNLQRVINQ